MVDIDEARMRARQGAFVPRLDVRRCRVCGCTENAACVDPQHGPCWWIEHDLCSHCGEPSIVAAEFDRMAIGVGVIPMPQFLLWAKKARVALGRASTVPAEAFEP